MAEGAFLEEGGWVAPRSGAGFAPLGRGGERLRPTFLFLSREKKKRADLRAKYLASLGCAPKRACGRRPGTKKKSAGSGFRDESCSFFLCALCPENGFPGAVRTGFTFCAAAADGCGWAGLRAGTNGFRCERRFFFLCVYVLMVGFLMLCGLVLPLAPLTLRGAGALMDYRSIW